MEKVPWQLKGELIANCNCTVFCPCALSLGHHPPTEGYCQTWFGVRIDDGQWGDASLKGLNVGLLVDIPHLMREGNWDLGIYLDERAEPTAAEGLERIFSGNAGGSTGLIRLLTGNYLGTQRVPIEYVQEGKTRRFNIGDKVRAEVSPVPGADPKEDVVVNNTGYWVSDQITIAQAGKAKVRDWGRVWDLSGRSAEICAIDWRGP